MKTELVAILLTDLSGFTEFSNQANRSDVATSIDQQKSLIGPVVQKYNGRLVKWIGDAALAVFTSATDAVLCGRAIQLKFIDSAERGTPLANSAVKVIVHVGDVCVDTDGDIYGDAVNVTARLEKVASPDEVFLSETVTQIVPTAEVPTEYVGSYELKGIPGQVRVFRTCFGQTPVVRERLLMVQTNFVHLHALADEHGWDRVHPIADDTTRAIIESCRANNGTSRGVMQTGCFLTFESVGSALQAIQQWSRELEALSAKHGSLSVKVRTAVHWGALHMMKYTMMGNDMDIIRLLPALGHGDDVLFTSAALEAAEAEHVTLLAAKTVAAIDLRECSSRDRWIAKFPTMTISRMLTSAL